MFMKFKAESENQLGKRIKRLRSDRGGEYSDRTLKNIVNQMELFMNLLLLTHHNKMA